MSEASRPTSAGIREGADRGLDDAVPRLRRSGSRFLQRMQRFLHLYPTTVPFVVLLLGLLLGVTVNPARFATGSNISTVLTQVTIIGILGIAQTMVILTAGIDLSVGVIMVISSVVMGRLAVNDGVPSFLGLSHSACLPASPAAISTERWSRGSRCRRSS